MLGLFEEDATAAQREAVMLGAKLQRWTCFFSWQDRGIAGPAESFHRAGLALWAGTADQRAQFHKRGIVSASVPSRQELGGGGPEPLAASGRVDRGLDVEDPGKDASDICFYDWNRLVECEGGNGVCRVTADARKVQDRFHIFWKSAAVLFHDGDSSRALRYRSASYWRFLRRAHLCIERWSVRRATWTHVFNRSGAARLARASSRVSYLPTWFDPEIVLTRTEPSAGGHSRALWVGRLEEEKDPILGMRALEAFVSRGGAGDARRAAMVGEGSLQASVLDERPAGSGVELRGSLSQADVAGEMAAADVLLMTSRFEGSPVVMNESLAAGTPVVGTEESDPDERIENGRNGFRCPERSAAALADAMATARSLSRSACIESVRELSAPLLVPRLFTTP